MRPWSGVALARTRILVEADRAVKSALAMQVQSSVDGHILEHDAARARMAHHCWYWLLARIASSVIMAGAGSASHFRLSRLSRKVSVFRRASVGPDPMSHPRTRAVR